MKTDRSPWVWMPIPLSVVLGASLAAQCVPQFQPLLQRTTVDGRILASCQWDPDGVGPLTERLVVGGVFTVAGGVPANHIAVYDFATSSWSALGSGVQLAKPWNSPFGGSPQVTAITVAPDHSLIAAGRFSHAGGRPSENVARWDGSTWQPLGAGVTLVSGNSLTGVACLPNGEVVVSGMLGWGTAASRWNGATWTPMPPLPTTPYAFGGTALLTRASGDLVLANDESTVGLGLIPRCGIYRWTGATWTSLGDTATTQLRACVVLAESPQGTLLAAGNAANGLSVRAFDGTTWTSFGTTTSTTASTRVVALAADAAGGATIAVANLAASPPVGTVLQASSATTAWTTLAAADGSVSSLARTTNGDLIACGAFDTCGIPAARIARWNGAWSAIGSGTQDRRVLCATPTPTGFVVGGSFRSIGGVPAAGVAEWTGSAWQALGSGLSAPVVQLARRSNGDLVARVRANNVWPFQHELHRWNGSTWNQLTPPVGDPVAMVVQPNDHVAVASAYEVHVWNGTTWNTLPGPLGSGPDSITAMDAAPNGDLIVGGWFYYWAGSVAERIVRWNGSAWQAIGTGPGGRPLAIEVQANGEILVAGSFYFGSQRHIAARFDGTSWSPVGAACRTDVPEGTLITREPNGDVLVAGTVLELGGLPVQNLARWSNGAWWPVARIATPTDWQRLPNGDLLVCGTALVDSTPTGDLARYTPGCAPVVADVPTLCVGPAGVMTATALQPAQLGGSLVTQCNGFTPTSIAVVVFGGTFLTPQLQLDLVLPGSLPGCELVPALDITAPVLPAAGLASAAVPLPSSASLAGAKLFHQFVQFALDASGNIQHIAASNALMLRLF